MAIEQRVRELLCEVSGSASAVIQPDDHLDQHLAEDDHQAMIDQLVDCFELSEGEMAFWSIWSPEMWSSEDPPSRPTVQDLYDVVLRNVGIDHDVGSLEDSIDFETIVYRWHEREHWQVTAPDRFFVPFQDGPWKWDAPGRFAGPAMNCGHYFGLTTEAATAEFEHYHDEGESAATHVLVELDVELRGVLDLTRPSVMQKVFRHCVEDERSEVSHNPMYIARELIAVEDWRGDGIRGGTGATDYIGWWAQRAGYSGVLFVGARAIEDAERLALDDSVFQEKWFGNWPSLQELRRDLDNINLVVFSGAALVDGTSRWRVHPPRGSFLRRLLFGERPSPWHLNPHFRRGAEEIYALSEYDLDFQQRHGTGFFTSKPGYEPLTEEDRQYLAEKQKRRGDET